MGEAIMLSVNSIYRRNVQRGAHRSGLGASGGAGLSAWARSGLVLLLGCLFILAGPGAAKAASRQQGAGAPSAIQEREALLREVKGAAWRLRIKEAAVVSGPMVTLGEIAVPAGDLPEYLWQRLYGLELWPSPEENGKPMNLTRPRIQQAMLAGVGRDFAMLCLYPPSMNIQRGGKLLSVEEVQAITVKTLTPLLGALPGESNLSDFRIPSAVFLQHPGQNLTLDAPAELTPGRLSLRYSVREPDGRVIRRLTGTVLVDSWISVPCATAVISKNEILSPEKIAFQRKNLAQLREEAWDGKSGPWLATRDILPGQPILQSSLGLVPTVRRGSVITLIYQGSSLRLATRVEALSDGARGESILVRNLSSKREVYATILDGGTVLIEAASTRVIHQAQPQAPLQGQPQQPAAGPRVLSQAYPQPDAQARMF
ncbi:flagellar basal body P-ring formation chaperone FlgA [Desulfovibrio sp. OttesenSCG-928-C14]|nr:flagellar basal body P-ring formation chaperone FlgA [Desulfovibrio sp. OttesenSCG-928-C14]